MIRKFLFPWVVFLFFAFSEKANAVYYSLSDFAKDYHAVLLYKNKPIQPIIEQNDTHAKPANLGIRIHTSYRAICKYDFPNYYVESDAEVILVVISPTNKERMFVFPLKEMR